MSSFACKVEIPPLKSDSQEEPLTVGRPFYLHCVGDWPLSINPDNLRLDLPEAQKYTLKLLNFTLRDRNSADLKVVSYQTGSNNFDKLNLSDKDQSYELTGVQFQVQSVIDSNVQKPEPFGPLSPGPLAWPQIYWIILFSLLSIGFAIVGRSLYKYIQRKKWLEEVRKYDNHLSPMSQFHSELRRMQRKYDFLGDPALGLAQIGPEQKAEILSALRNDLGIYFIREFRIHGLNPNPKAMLRELKKYHRKIAYEHHETLKSWWKEFDKISKAKTSIMAKDLQQLLREARELVERLTATAEPDDKKGLS